MAVPATERLGHVKESIDNIRRLLAGKTIEDMSDDTVARAALERFLEILCEASRHVPDAWKDEFGPDIPWQDIADFGNILRHVYDQVDLKVLWDVYERDLNPLEAAIDSMLAAHLSKDTSL